MLIIKREKDTNETFNDVEFPKQGYSFYIDKYIVSLWKMIEAKQEDVKIKKSGKWNYCESIRLRYLLIKYRCLPL